MPCLPSHWIPCCLDFLLHTGPKERHVGRQSDHWRAESVRLLWAVGWHEIQHRLHIGIWRQAWCLVGLVHAVEQAQRWSMVAGAAAVGRHVRHPAVATPCPVGISRFAGRSPVKIQSAGFASDVPLPHVPAQGWVSCRSIPVAGHVR